MSEGIFRNFRAMRRTGYTTNLVEMCLEKKCPVIFANSHQRDFFKKDFKDLCGISLSQFEKIPSIKGPYYLDNSALEVILQRWEDSERTLSKLTRENEELNKRNSLLFEEFVAIRRAVIDELEKNSLLEEQLRGLWEQGRRGLFRKFLNFFKGK